MFSYPEMKKLIYFVETGFGLIALIIACRTLHLATHSSDPIGVLLAGIVLLPVGTICLLFTSVAFILRDDPDIWR